MEKENHYLNALKEAERVNKEDEAEYLKRYKEFSKLVQSGKFKIQGEDE